MYTDPELTKQVVGAILLILLVCGVFYWAVRSNKKYVFIPDEEKDLMLDLMIKSTSSKLTLDDWKTYLVGIGMAEDQFNELITEMRNKMFE